MRFLGLSIPLTLCLVLGMDPALAAGKRLGVCPPYKGETKVKVYFLKVKPRYFYDHTQRQITERRGSTPHTMAVTEQRIHTQWGPHRVEAHQNTKTKSICARLAEVTYKIGFTKLDVYLPRDYPKGSCEYDELLKHEHEHVTIAQGLFKKIGPEIARDLRSETRNIGLIRAASSKAAGKTIAERIEEIAMRQTRRLETLRRKAQARIDTPENYRAINARCTNWKDTSNPRGRFGR